MRETAWAGVGTHDTTRCASSGGQTRWYRRNEILEASDLNQSVLAVVPHACASESVLSRFEDTAHAHCAPALRDVVVLAHVTVHCFDFFEASGVGLGCGGDHFAGNVCC